MRKTTHIKPYHMEMKSTSKGFELHIMGKTKNGISDNCIIFYFENWWISFFVKDFKRILSEKLSELHILKNLFNNV